MRQNYNIESFTKDNRLFYFGITFVIVGLIFLLYFSLTENNVQSDKIIEKYYFYKNVPHLDARYNYPM